MTNANHFANALEDQTIFNHLTMASSGVTNTSEIRCSAKTGAGVDVLVQYIASYVVRSRKRRQSRPRLVLPVSEPAPQASGCCGNCTGNQPQPHPAFKDFSVPLKDTPYKTVLLGATGVGKSSLLYRIQHPKGTWTLAPTEPTIGAAFAQVTVRLKKSTGVPGKPAGAAIGNAPTGASHSSNSTSAFDDPKDTKPPASFDTEVKLQVWDTVCNAMSHRSNVGGMF